MWKKQCFPAWALVMFLLITQMPVTGQKLKQTYYFNEMKARSIYRKIPGWHKIVGYEVSKPHGFELLPKTDKGSDGPMAMARYKGYTIYRGTRAGGSYPAYMYFQVPKYFPERRGSFYVEIVYLDIGRGGLNIQYSCFDPKSGHREAPVGYGKLMANTHQIKKAVFYLPNAVFDGKMSMQTDLRIQQTTGSQPIQIVSIRLHDKAPAFFNERHQEPLLVPYNGPRKDTVDANTIRKKVMCGYQGWFRAPGDPAEMGWVHYSRSRGKINSNTLTIDMWPDVSDYDPTLLYPADDLVHADGSQAKLFSSADYGSVLTHYKWMEEYGIDGTYHQRFTVSLIHGQKSSLDASLSHTRNAANATGRVFCLTYDLSGTGENELLDILTKDWKFLVDEAKLTEDPRYLKHNGRPVLELWGFFDDRFSAATANKVLDFFLNDPKYGVYLVGGVNDTWREYKGEWAKAVRRFDVISPWNVGRTSRDENGNITARTSKWADDKKDADKNAEGLMPVLYCGFSWKNLKGKQGLIPRRKGDFLWEQVHKATSTGFDMLYIAMFDEVDEATCIFKVTNDPPVNAFMETYEGMPSDWYLRLVGEATKYIKKGQAAPAQIPIKP